MKIKGVEINCVGYDNTINISVGAEFQASRININGNNNKIDIEDCSFIKNFTVNFKGDSKTLVIRESNRKIDGLKLVSIRGNSQCFKIGRNFSCGGMEVQMNDGGEYIDIGDDCLFSWGIKARTSDGHSVIDIDTGRPINYPKDIIIGDRVWIGEDVKILKGVVVRSDCVVGAGSLLTKKFESSNSVIAGVPARIVKKNIRWDYRYPYKIDESEGSDK